MDPRCLIRQSDTYGIPGGWTLHHPSVPLEIAERSPEAAVATLAAMLRVNNIAATIDQLWDHANDEWGRRLWASGLKDRWMGAPLDTSPSAMAPVTAVAHMRRILTPKDTGPSLWGTLHLIPLVWTRAAWLAHLDLMTRLIEPGGFEMGCKLCAGHWKSFRLSSPPESIHDAKAAAHWSWQAHNAASQHAGNASWTWRKAAAKWGWPGEWEV